MRRNSLRQLVMVLLLVVIVTPAAADDILIDCGVNNFLIKENFLGFKSLQWREEKQGDTL